MIGGGWSSARRWWVGTFAFATALGAAWAIASPIFTGPDEPAHVVRAYAAAHGQIEGDDFGPRNVPPYPVPVDPKPWISSQSFDGPGIYRGWGNINCTVFQLNGKKSTAECLRLEGPDHEVRILVTGSRHPPWYYATVGTVSLVVQPGRAQIYAMRLLSALLAAALIASAVVTLMTFAPNRFTLLGIAAALTPMVAFLTGTVNPSAVEIAAGIGLWAHGVVLALGGLEAQGKRLIHRFGIAAVALVLARPGSVLWLVLIVAVLMLIAGWERIKALLGDGLIRRWIGGTAAAVLLQVGWSLHTDSLDLRKALQVLPLPDSTSTSEIVRHIVGAQYTFLREMIGVFGWLDTPAPSVTFLIWMLTIGFLIGMTLLVAERRFALAVGVLLALCFVVPVVYEASVAGDIGYFWQGRYLIPLAVGIPILAGLGVARAQQPTLRFVLPVGIGLAFAHFLGYWQALRRYSVGANGTIWFFTASKWDPPLPSVLLLIGFAALLGAGVYVLCNAKIDADREEPALQPS